jgi:adenylate cyclase
LEVLSRPDTAGLPRQLVRRFTLVIAPINLVIATVTYVFVAYVVPLPGRVPPARARTTVLIAAVVGVAAAWAVCELWGRRSFVPIRYWLERGGEPDEVARTRAVRLALREAWHTLVVWLVAGVGFGAVDVSVGGSAAAGALMAVTVAVGGLSASALTYLAVEWMMRPVIALALADDPRERPRSTGIATRIYLAWEFGTAAAVCGAVVVAIAYLAGGGMSPRRMAATVIFLGALALAVGLVTLLVAIRSVSHPVRGLRDAMARVEAGDNDVQVPVDDGGEVGLLQAGFNRMVAGLRERDRIRDLFGRHVGEEVARSALSRGLELGGELRDVAVLFVDVIGSTPFACARARWWRRSTASSGSWSRWSRCTAGGSTSSRGMPRCARSGLPPSIPMPPPPRCQRPASCAGDCAWSWTRSTRRSGSRPGWSWPATSAPLTGTSTP